MSPASKFKIRSACHGDSLAIASLISQLGYPTSSGEMNERLAAILPAADYMTFVAEHNEEVVGMIGVAVGHYYEKNGTYGRLLALVVDGNCQGHGIGASLVAEAERWLKERGANSVIVNSGKQRKDAHRFYQRLGYEETGSRFVKQLR